MKEEDIRIRRLYMEDEEWERTHNTWKQLKPKRNFKESTPSDETCNEYAQRIRTKFNIPEQVLIQWHYVHIYNADMVNNYGWLDFSRVTFTLQEWSHQDLTKLRIFSGFEEYVKPRSNLTSFDDFCCNDEDKNYWKIMGTWRVPIIIMKTENLISIPDYAELNRPYQLVEGHSRYGYYNAFKRLCEKGQFHMPETHKVFLMSVSQ